MTKTILQSISNFFHPLLSMLWATVLMVYYTPICVLPASLRWFIVAEVAFYSLLLPSAIIVLLSRLGFVRNGVALRDRKDRIIPLGIQIATYIAQAVTLGYEGLPAWAMQFFWGAVLLAALCFVVSIWWKISAHAAGNASLATASLVVYYLFPQLFPFWIPIVMIVMTGFVCSIRLYLGRHTLAQVSCGALAGVACMLLGGLFV